MFKPGDRVVWFMQLQSPRSWHGIERCPKGYEIREVKNFPGMQAILVETLSGNFTWANYYIGTHQFILVSTIKKIQRNLPGWF